jgi:hypothetical protein
VGSVFINRSGTENATKYVKQTGTGNTGWVAVITSINGGGA